MCCHSNVRVFLNMFIQCFFYSVYVFIQNTRLEAEAKVVLIHYLSHFCIPIKQRLKNVSASLVKANTDRYHIVEKRQQDINNLQRDGLCKSLDKQTLLMACI